MQNGTSSSGLWRAESLGGMEGLKMHLCCDIDDIRVTPLHEGGHWPSDFPRRGNDPSRLQWRCGRPARATASPTVLPADRQPLRWPQRPGCHVFWCTGCQGLPVVLRKRSSANPTHTICKVHNWILVNRFALNQKEYQEEENVLNPQED